MNETKIKRAVFFAKFSLVANVFLALSKMGIGLFTQSFILFVGSLYNIGLCVARVVSLTGFVRGQSEGDIVIEYKSYLSVGIIITVTSAFFCAYNCRWFWSGEYSSYPLVVALAIAVSTFIKLGLGLYGSWITRNDKDPAVASMKLTNFADALVSLVLVQAALMPLVFEADVSAWNGVAGVVFGAVAALIGVYMTVHMVRLMKKARFVERD